MAKIGRKVRLYRTPGREPHKGGLLAHFSAPEKPVNLAIFLRDFGVKMSQNHPLLLTTRPWIGLDLGGS